MGTCFNCGLDIDSILKNKYNLNKFYAKLVTIVTLYQSAFDYLITLQMKAGNHLDHVCGNTFLPMKRYWVH